MLTYLKRFNFPFVFKIEVKIILVSNLWLNSGPDFFHAFKLQSVSIAGVVNLIKVVNGFKRGFKPILDVPFCNSIL